MKNILFVFIGGGLGSVCRYGASLLALSYFPIWGQLIGLGFINTLGGLGAGFLFSKLSSEGASSLWLIGFMGGFTTFSAFSLELVKMLEEDKFFLALIFMSLSLIGSLFAAWLAYRVS